jgi:hypothetical protein
LRQQHRIQRLQQAIGRLMDDEDAHP